MVLTMDALVDLPEIKSEIKAEDFAVQQHNLANQQQQPNCQWVSTTKLRLWCCAEIWP